METQNFKVDANKKLVFLGCGAVAKVALHWLHEFVNVNYDNVYLVDIADVRKAPALQDIFKRGATFLKLKVEEDEYETFFKLLKLKPLDIVVDLLTSSNYIKMVEVCRKLSLIYINASLELDLPFAEGEAAYDSSILRRHDLLDNLNKKLQGTDPYNATHVFEFGMNPGLISHFVLKGLLDVCKLVLQNKEDAELAQYVENREFAKIARHLGVEVIHCSEIDNQVAKIQIDDDMFVNTWSCVGFLDEGLKAPEIGWGTHEKKLPPNGEIIGPNQVAIKMPSYKALHRSYVPDEEFVGMDVPHGEAISLPKFLSTEDYTPTVQYVYRLCPQTRACLARMPFDQLSTCKRFKVLEPSSCEMEGNNRVGGLLILKKNPITGENKTWCHWSGSIIGQELSKFCGPTVIQVGVGVLCALKWAVSNPQKGPNYSEALPSEWIIEQARPFLGTIFSGPVSWSPASTQFNDLSVIVQPKIESNIDSRENEEVILAEVNKDLKDLELNNLNVAQAL